MTTALLIILIVLVVGLGVAVFLLASKLSKSLVAPKEDDKGMLMLNQNMQGMQERLDNTTEAINTRLDKAAQSYAQVREQLGQMQEIGRNMRDLQDFLRSPKLRGNIGEHVLKDLLEQAFSRKHFDLQYRFKDGAVVDAVIKTDKGIIPIDAKFPLENFNKMVRAEAEADEKAFRKEFVRDVKRHIDAISKKYVLPGEGTVDFAVMYIPSESIYYEMIRGDLDLNAYGHQKKVFPVSPNSFYYFLRVILLGMEGQKIEAASRKILLSLAGIQRDAGKVGDAIGVLNTHVNNSRSALDRLSSEYQRLSANIDNTRLLEADEAVELPDQESSKA